jgi:hypothetical protein
MTNHEVLRALAVEARDNAATPIERELADIRAAFCDLEPEGC